MSLLLFALLIVIVLCYSQKSYDFSGVMGDRKQSDSWMSGRRLVCGAAAGRAG